MLNIAFNKIFHLIATAIFSSIRIQSRFNTKTIIIQIINNMIGNQIKQPCLFHKIDILLNRLIHFMKIIGKSTVLILRINFISSYC